MEFELLLLSALLVDLLLGDPKWFPHPVRLIGLLCLRFEKIYRTMFASEKLAGIFTSLTILFLTGAGTTLLLILSGGYAKTLQTIVAVFILYTFIATKDLLIHSRNVFDNLFPVEKLAEARLAISAVVGRDTAELNGEGVSRACIETVGENMVDGITAPLFWAIMFSFLALLIPGNAIGFAAVGMSLYKAANTMDSMFGYKNDKYLHFGWFPARFDDVVNLLPARLSGVCVVMGFLVSGGDWRGSLRIFLRDRLNHTSPNAGHTESAIAGGLGVQLGGPSFYFGKLADKPTMGEPHNAISPCHILMTHRIVIISVIIFLAAALFMRRMVFLLITG